MQGESVPPSPVEILVPVVLRRQAEARIGIAEGRDLAAERARSIHLARSRGPPLQGGGGNNAQLALDTLGRLVHNRPMQVRAILKQVSQLAGAEAVATVQLTGLVNYETFHDGYSVSHAIEPSLLTPGAQIVVEIPDLHHPGDGQVVSVAGVSTGAGTVPIQQFASTLVTVDGSGNGSAAVVFPNTFGAFTATPSVGLSAAATQLGAGTLAAAAVTASGFTVNVAGAAVTNSVLAVAWSASGR